LFLINLEGNDMSELSRFRVIEIYDDFYRVNGTKFNHYPTPQEIEYAYNKEDVKPETITIPIAEYEAMRLDAERLSFLIDNGLWFVPLEEQKRGYRSTMPDARKEMWFERVGWMVNNANKEHETVRDAIDAAIKEGN
jgi:hypothetical protein